jgi:NADH:ubiquinone oxidoreductase subunit 6 (subunit J)
MTGLLSQEGLTGLVFLVLLGATGTGAIIAVTAGRLIRSVVGLLLAFIGIAGIYYFLNSPFVALMQLLIYVGAVGIVIVFAVMLAEPRPENQPCGGRTALTGILGFLTAGVLFAGLSTLALSTTWHPHGATSVDGSMEAVGRSLLTTYSMVFELISIVLLVAIIGSLVLARVGREKS